MTRHNPALLAVLALLSLPATAEAQTGDPFGTRDIEPCTKLIGIDTTDPTAKDLAYVVRCRLEKQTGDKLVLVEDAALSVGRGNTYDPAAFPQLVSPDRDQRVYAFNGTLTLIECRKISSTLPKGSNCEEMNRKVSGHLYWNRRGELDVVINLGR